ncbi:MAG: MMPL family transporter [Ilumatobacteraceae bacterium]
MRVSPQTLARASSRRPWLTVGIWVAAIVASIAISSTLLSGALTNETRFVNNPEAKRALQLVEDRLHGKQGPTEMVIFQSDTSTVDDPHFRDFVEQTATDLAALGPTEVKAVADFYKTNDDTMVSKDRRTLLLPIVLAYHETGGTDTVLRELRAIADRPAPAGLTTRLYGNLIVNDDFTTIAERDLRTGEAIGILVALVVLLIVFGAFVAGVIPIATGLTSITIAVALVAVIGQHFKFSFFVTNMIAMMGLALGIDYSLFIISRYREERSRGLDKLAAIEASGATASRAVFFSGLTVVIALLGMLIVPTTIFRSLAGGAILVAIVAMLASLTLLPAILGLIGDRVNAGRIRRRPRTGAGRPGGFWDRVTQTVMKRPVTSLLIGGGLLVAAAIPTFSLRTGFAGVSTLPSSSASRQAFDVLAKEFAGGLSSPVEIVVDGDMASPAVRAGIEQIRAALSADGSFGPSVVETNSAGDLAMVSAPVTGDPASSAAVASIGRVRDRYVPDAFPAGTARQVLVGGNTAFNKDFFDMTDHYMPIVFAFVLGMSFILLTIVFRSIVVPIKAIIMNLLSVGAAYGLMVLVLQKGVGAGLLGLQKVEVIEAWIPLFLFSVLFGLSMDYHVFLLTRVREHYDQTGDNTESVAHGLRTTAAIITGAALIMVAVFGGFASGTLVPFQQVGFGLAVAVLLDATLVRSVLVPASMKLLGTRNWYLPRWLEWLPNLHVEGAEPTNLKALESLVVHPANDGADPSERRDGADRPSVGTAPSRHHR